MERLRPSAGSSIVGAAVLVSLGLIVAPVSLDPQSSTAIPEAAEAKNGNGGGTAGSDGDSAAGAEAGATEGGEASRPR